jgi:hypothetical protein
MLLRVLTGCLLVVGLATCVTSRPKDDTPVVVDTNPPPSSEPSAAPVEIIELPPPLPIINEPLPPVRGGARVLPPYRGPEPCKMALAGQSPVAKACSAGGIRKAIELMQSFVRRARAEGFVFECADCHPDEDDHSKLAPQAEQEFRKLLFLARPDN